MVRGDLGGRGYPDVHGVLETRHAGRHNGARRPEKYAHV